MKILVLGGTAFLGRDIVRLLRAEGNNVTVFSRHPADAPSMIGDRTQRESLSKAKDTWDVVIDNIGYTAPEMELALDIFKNAKHFIFTSTVSVYRYMRTPGKNPIQENDVDFTYRPKEENLNNIHWSYARGKLEAEKTVIEKSKVPYTIIRPPVIYGPNDESARGFWYLLRILDGNPLLISDSGNQDFRLSYSLDVAKLYLRAIQNRKQAEGQIYNVAQKEIITPKDFIQESAKGLGKTTQTLAIPRLALGELGGPYANMPFFISDFSKAERELGFKPTPFEEFATQTAKWFLEQPQQQYAEQLKTRPQELALAKQWQEKLSKNPKMS